MCGVHLVVAGYGTDTIGRAVDGLQNNLQVGGEIPNLTHVQLVVIVPDFAAAILAAVGFSLEAFRSMEKRSVRLLNNCVKFLRLLRFTPHRLTKVGYGLADGSLNLRNRVFLNQIAYDDFRRRFGGRRRNRVGGRDRVGRCGCGAGGRRLCRVVRFVLAGGKCNRKDQCYQKQ